MMLASSERKRRVAVGGVLVNTRFPGNRRETQHAANRNVAFCCCETPRKKETEDKSEGL